MKPRFSSLLSRLIVPFLVAVPMIGCKREAPPTAAVTAPAIPVSNPLRREITEYAEFTGRTDAVDSIGIKARATGYLISAPFVEGSEVKKGDLLFEIDPRPYKAQLEQAESQVQLADVQLRLAKANYDRVKATGASASATELDQAKASQEAAEAQLRAAKATAEVYRLNLSYTRVLSPIDGQTSRFYFTVGNLVNQDQTTLTTVVSTGSMYAYFDVDERTLFRIRTGINQGKIRARGENYELPVFLGLDGEEGYPHKGAVNFSNNVLNPSTATLSLRGLFDNPKPDKGRRLLSPGMFVRIRLPIGEQHPATLIVDRAIASDQGLKYVYVVDAEKKVRYRRIKTGSLQDDGLRVVEEGLEPTDLVVIGAIQQLRPGQEIEPEMTAMPTPGTPQAAPSTPKPAK